MLEINANWTIPDSELRFTFARSSGPGGQNVNKVNSKVTLHWAATTTTSLPADVRERFCREFQSRLTRQGELVLQCQTHRDQGRNVEDCLQRLRAMILSAAVPRKKRRPTKPTFGSRQRRLEHKKSRSQTKSGRRSKWES